MKIEDKVKRLKDYFSEHTEATREELMKVVDTNSVYYFRQILSLARLTGLNVQAVKSVTYKIVPAGEVAEGEVEG